MKKIWLALLACLTFVCLMFAASCSLLQPKTKLAFNEGYLQEITLGDPIVLDEYINPMLTEDYTAILTCDETGQERDLKALGQWTTDKPGVYTLTYTVNSGEFKGTIETKINVIVPTVSWQYSRPTLVYRAGETINFNLLKRNLNLMVKSYYGYEFFMKSVSFNEKKEDLEGKTTYTFPEEGTYTFTFAIRTEDGQELSADQKISVRPQQVLAEGAEDWMEENNITSYDYTYISPDGKVTLDAGYYSSIIKDNVPYIAFNGEEGVGYGANTYVMVEFTGKNLPQVAFFCDEVTSSYTDGKKGIVFTNGITNNNGTDYFGTKLNMSRLTIFGPNKVSFPEYDNRARILALGSESDPCPMSYHALSDTDSYRYIIGIEEATSTSFVARILLINTTTGERVFDYKQKMTNSSGIGNFNFDSDFYSGSIVLYGRFGLKSEFDKVYMPITGINDIYELDQAASFKDSYKKQYDFNATAWVSDYIDIPDTDYEFTVIAPNGEKVPIGANGEFKYTMSGKYLLRFDPKQEGVRASAITVRVMYDLQNKLAPDCLELDGALINGGDIGITMNRNEKFIKEGSQSIQNYIINGKYPTMDIYVSKSLMEFLFLSRNVQGITFEVYSEKAATFALNGNGKEVVLDYTGEIPAETWTTLTITRDLCMKNADIYKNNGYSVAIMLTAVDDTFFAHECVYIDNVQLYLGDSVPTISNGAKAWMEANNVEAYGYDSITDDLQVNLQEGMYQKDWYNLTNDDVPYIAYKGNYAAGSYVVVDFTGKNVPQIALFVDRITSSLVDGHQGLYIHTGMIMKSGDLVSEIDGGRVSFLGPNKIEYCRPDADGRVGKQFGTKGWQPDGSKDEAGTTVSPLSIRGLQDGVHYRYVVGIKTAKDENGKGRIVLDLLLLNLDTKEEVVRYEWSEATAKLSSLIDGGSIVMYSRYNTPVTFDKIYAVYENVTNINAIDKVAEILG